MGDNFVILIVLAALCGLFMFRFMRNRKLYDLLVLGILVLVGITKLPIGEKIPQFYIITIVLGLGVFIVLLFIKDKSVSVKNETKVDDDKK